MERDHRVASGARGDPFSRSGAHRRIVGFHSSRCHRRRRSGTGRRWRGRRQRIGLARRTSPVRASEIRPDGDAQGDAGDNSTGEAASAKASGGVARNPRAAGRDSSSDNSDDGGGKRHCRDGGCRTGNWRWSRVGGRCGAREWNWSRHRRWTRKGLSADGERFVHTTNAGAVRGEGVSPESILRCRRKG
ncbi:MAG: hypothetical protein QOH22_1819 [Gemmatimonadaceae bacterium]|jgi:hypothetical protein|nr:hypothetical protein [Gemmatimonadaceae bacterium]